MMIREPAVAGRFYPGEPEQCLAEVKACLGRIAQAPESKTTEAESIIGGIVPHAGWLFSGAIAAQVFAEISLRVHPQAVVVFGAIHVLHGPRPTVFGSGAWETPLGLAKVDERLSSRLLGQTGFLENNPHAHEGEHSIEVEVPFIQHLMPDSLVVPIMVPVNENAVVVGRAVGRACKSYGVKAVFVGSTDLTHYGPSYHFTPQGLGDDALKWMKDVNDKQMIDLVLAMRADDAVREAVMSKNACGGGAVAATLAACETYGAERAILLAHATSSEIQQSFSAAPSTDSVGYAGILID